MKQYSLDSKQDFLDALNAANNTSLTLEGLQMSQPEQHSGELLETNTAVRVSDSKSEVVIGYCRQPPSVAFGHVTGLQLNESREGEESVEIRALRMLCAESNFPYDAECISGSIVNGQLKATYTNHYVLDGSVEIPVVVNAYTPIDTLVDATTMEGFLSDYTAPTEPTSRSCLLKELLDLNPRLTEDKLTLSEPRAGGDIRPTDSVIIKPIDDNSPYTGSAEFTYSRLNLESLVKGSIDIGFFNTFTDFYNTVTPEYVANLLTTQLQVPVSAEEVRVRDQKDIDGTFSARVTVVNNYVVRSTGGIFITGGKDL
jgi:hypothetical protein